MITSHFYQNLLKIFNLNFDFQNLKRFIKILISKSKKKKKKKKKNK